jgi:hypothetical protein
VTQSAVQNAGEAGLLPRWIGEAFHFRLMPSCFSFPAFLGEFQMHYRSKPWLVVLAQSPTRMLIATFAIVGFTVAGCDKFEGLVEDGKDLVNGEEPAVADTPTVTEPGTQPPITPTQPVVPAGPTPQQIVDQFTALQPNQISDGSLAQLASSPEAAAAITEIDMHGAKVSATGLGYLSVLPNLESLNASGLPVTPDSLTAIGKAKSLKNLDLSYSGANDQVVSELSQIPHLQTLNLNGTQVTGGSATGLGSMRELTDLMLMGTAANDQVIAALTSLPIRKLDLAKSRITNASLPMLLKIPTLEVLNVSFCQITGDGFKGFGKSNIKEMSVGETQFGIEGFAAIRGMSALENLNVYSAGLVEHKSVNVFRTFPKLKILNAGRNSVTDAGMVVFLKATRRWKTFGFTATKASPTTVWLR